MSLKYSFAFAVLIATGVFAMGQLGLLADVGAAMPYALAALVLVAAAGAWFVDLLDRRLSAMQQAVQRLSSGEDSLRLGAASRGAPDALARPFADMASAVNQRLSELQTVIAQQRAIAEHGPDAMWVFHVEAFQIIDANENFAKLTGHPRNRLVGMTLMAIAPPEQQGMATEAYTRGLVQRALGGEKLEVPWTVRRTDGVDVPCELRAIHLPAPGRTLICGMLLDISERHRTLSELDRRMRFESLVTRLSTSFISLPIEEADEAVTDALGEVGRFAAVDRAYIFEFSASRDRVSCTHEWCEHGITPQLQRLQGLAVGTYSWCLARIQRGDVVAVDRVDTLPPEAAEERAEWQAEDIRSILLVPIHNAAGVTGYVGFDAVRAEVQWPTQLTTLLKLFGEMVSNLLARKRSQRTLQEQNENLGRANTELARSNQELQQFAYIASHDLQEPLRKIQVFSNMLQPLVPEEGRDYLQRMQKSVRRMQTLISDLLALSRVNRKGQPFKMVSLNTALEAVLEDMQVILEETGATVQVEPLGTVFADAGQVRQLFQNLLDNALKYHRENTPPRIKIYGRLLPGGQFYQTIVEDNGLGIAPAFYERILEPFQRLHGVSQYPGSGMGLAICKKITERHNGSLSVSSELGVGSQFSFSLPVQAPINTNLQNASSENSGENSRNHSEKI